MICLVKGKRIKIDNEDLDLFNTYTWCLGGGQRKYVCALGPNRRLVYLHRLLTKASVGQEVDHINRNTLDNRKCNLRLVTSSLNKLNIPKRKDNTSGATGVSWSNSTNKWRARISYKGVEKVLGYFKSKEEAIKARKIAEQKLWSI